MALRITFVPNSGDSESVVLDGFGSFST
ncbi:hypothetical protein A2U01_0063180, partial [Trifolium medium]|nr:hypothetical protein [Trifolium medium]